MGPHFVGTIYSTAAVNGLVTKLSVLAELFMKLEFMKLL